MPRTPKKTGRPQKAVDEKLIRRAARIGCTSEEIAALCDVSKDTLERRFAAVLKKGREGGKSSLRRMQWKAAKGGNVTMQIWLGKQLLEQKDKSDVTSGGEKISLAPIKLDGDREL